MHPFARETYTQSRMNKQSCIQTLRGILFLIGLMPLLTGCGVASVKSSDDQKRPSPPGKSDDKSPLLIADYFMQHTAYFRGSCDGSGGVALDKDHFAVVNDETSHLLVYKRHDPGEPIQSINLRKALELKKKEEGDLEALALVKDYLFVLGSHSRDRDGKKQKERRKLLALRLRSESGVFDLKPLGDVYEDLMGDLEDHDAFDELGLKQSAGEAGSDPEGFNIEGLCSGSDGILWLCFRGPRIGARALLIPMINPVDIMAGVRPRFGKHQLLDLQGRTIRGADNFGGHIIFVADTDKVDLGPAIYIWDEQGNDVTQLHTPELRSIDPESVVIFPDTGLQELLVLSDDGGRRFNGKDCKDWNGKSDKRFRSVTYRWLQP